MRNIESHAIEIMKSQSAQALKHISLLSDLMFRGSLSSDGAEGVAPSSLPESEEEFAELVELANKHHVIVRALAALGEIAQKEGRPELHGWCDSALQREKKRIANAVEWLHAILQALENAGCSVCVIKSLDHWPDLGSDLDLYTSCSSERTIRVMSEKLQARQEPRSWGDRLANKWNFQVPRLPELVEVHVRYLGQTGEQKLMAERVLERRATKTINSRSFTVPAPEEQILISTLQRMYRHFYFRLCDMADSTALLQAGEVDFDELRRGAEAGGIWRGVASFLVIVAEYVGGFGINISLPAQVRSAAHSPDLAVRFQDDFLRVPMRPAASLYGSQLFSAGKHADMRAISRLPLLPPLAVSAVLAYRLTGSDKGIW